MIFDAHCHLGEVAGRAGKSGGVRGRLLCGTGPGDWSGIHTAAAGWAGTVAAYGMHPWRLAEQAGDAWLGELREFLLSDAGAWVGEAGLDFRRIGDPLRQREACLAQLELAAALGRGASLHCLGAEKALLELLDRCPPTPAVLHSYSGSHQALAELVRRGMYFSVGPLAPRHDGRKVRARIALIPPDRLLLESDAFLAPGVDAEELLRSTLAWLADLHGIASDSLETLIDSTARKVFSHVS